MIVVSDTTPIITLLKVGQLKLLQLLFQDIQIPEAVFGELTANPRFQEEADEIRKCPFIHVKHIEDKEAVSLLCRATGLNQGESEAIILMDKLNAELLLMDEAKGRDVAKQMGLKIMGTIGLLMASFEEHYISAKEMEACLKILRTENRHIGNQYLQLLRNKIDKER